MENRGLAVDHVTGMEKMEPHDLGRVAEARFHRKIPLNCLWKQDAPALSGS